MTFHNCFDKVFEQACVIQRNDTQKYILFSDIHRGAGDYSDHFMENQQVFFAALQYYCKEGYTYIELGDGDELWENWNFSDIREAHDDVFWLMSTMYREGRLYMLYGNHDMVKKDEKYRSNHCASFYCQVNQSQKPLFEDISIPESIKMTDDKGRSILLTHGNQGDLINDRFWRLGRFLVRFLWRPLNLFGLVEPTSAAKNHHKTNRIERRLIKWSSEKKNILITGHTHRAYFPKPGDYFGEKQILYFNTGSCVHPRCITGIEIVGDCISLIKWCISIRENRNLYVERTVLEGPADLKDYE